MKPFFSASCILSLVLLLFGCGGGSGSESTPTQQQSTIEAPASSGDTPVAWNNAVVYEPFTTKAIPLASIAPDAVKAPVMVFMHGCTGIAGSAAAWGTTFAAMGYRVVQPDSMKRPDRANRRSCDPVLFNGSIGNTDIYDKRIDEASYSVEMVKRQRWFDGKGLILVGHSEGGLAVTQTSHRNLVASFARLMRLAILVFLWSLKLPLIESCG